MVSTAQKPGSHRTPANDKKSKKSYPAAFTKYKFYLDVKSSKVKSNLVDDIIALGGTLLDFLTKEVTHVISEGPEWKFLLSTNGSCGPPSPWTPGTATPSPSTSLDGDKARKPKSRVETFLGSTRTAEKGNSNDILEVAKRFNCLVWSLNKTVNWLNKFKAKYGNLSPGVRPTQRHKERELHTPFIKLTSTLRHARPAIAEFKAWPKISLDGWAGTSPFSEQKKKCKRKNLAKRLDLNGKKEEGKQKKECPKKKEGGFCEICNKSYSELERHLKGQSHTLFVKDLANWTELDSNIENNQEKAHAFLF